MDIVSSDTSMWQSGFLLKLHGLLLSRLAIMQRGARGLTYNTAKGGPKAFLKQLKVIKHKLERGGIRSTKKGATPIKEAPAPTII